MINTQIKKLREDICNVINQSQLPIGIARLTLESILVEVSAFEERVIASEVAQNQSEPEQEDSRE